MAFATSQISNFSKSPIGNGYWDIWFKFTGPASYGSGGDAMTRAQAIAALEGISEVTFLVAATAGGDSYTNGALCTFEPINNGTNAGKFHFYNAVDAHTHDMKIIGGQGAAGTDAVTCPAATDLLGKQEAGNADILGADVLTKGGVMLCAADAVAAEAAAASAFQNYVCWFRGIGKM